MLSARIEKLDILDLGLIKLAVACFVLFLVFGFESIHYSLSMVPWWIYLILTVVLAIRPQMRVWAKPVQMKKKGKK